MQARGQVRQPAPRARFAPELLRLLNAVAAPRDVWAVIRRGTSRAVIHGDGEAWAVSAAPLAAPTTLAGAAGVVWAGDASGAVAA